MDDAVTPDQGCIVEREYTPYDRAVLARLPQLNHDLTLFLSFRIAKWLFLLMSIARIWL